MSASWRRRWWRRVVERFGSEVRREAEVSTALMESCRREAMLDKRNGVARACKEWVWMLRGRWHSSTVEEEVKGAASRGD